MPEQRPMYIESIGETKGKFMSEIEEVMKRIAVDAYKGNTYPETYLKDLKEPRTFFYRSMKGTIPITPEDVEELVIAEVNRQEEFYLAIRKLTDKITQGKILPPDKIVEHPHWDHRPSFGCNIRSGSTVLYTYPRLPASTEQFLTLKQAPVPSNVIHVEEEYILMLPYGQDFNRGLREIFSEFSGDMDKLYEEEIGVELMIHDKFLSLITEEIVYQKSLDKILKDYDGLAVQVGRQSSNTAYIHTGMEENLPRLWRTIYFDWNGNWRRHQ